MSVFGDLNIINTILILEVGLLLSTNHMYNKKRKIMELNNLSRANSLAAEKKSLEGKITQIMEFPYDKASAKVWISYGDKEFLLPAEFCPLDAGEIAQLTINRLNAKIEKINKEIITL